MLSVEIIKPISSGSFGIVYKGIYQGRNVAVKVPNLMNKNKNGFDEYGVTKEILNLTGAKFNHPNIVEIHGYCFSPEGFGLVMELYPGHLDVKKSIDIWKVLEGISSGMEYLHSLGWMHRDLKESNILMSADGTPKISDFGSSKHLNKSDYAHTTIGTGYYRAPEVREKYTFKADVYSFGHIVSNISQNPSVNQPQKEFLQSLFEKCCSIIPEKRPDFSSIRKELNSIQSMFLPRKKIKLESNEKFRLILKKPSLNKRKFKGNINKNHKIQKLEVFKNRKTFSRSKSSDSEESNSEESSSKESNSEESNSEESNSEESNSEDIYSEDNSSEDNESQNCFKKLDSVFKVPKKENSKVLQKSLAAIKRMKKDEIQVRVFYQHSIKRLNLMKLALNVILKKKNR